MKSAIYSVVLILLGFVGIVAAPFCATMIANDVHAHNVLTMLKSVRLPENAVYTSERARTANLGNSDGCDFEAIVTISYDGPIGDLAARYLEVVKPWSEARELYLGPSSATFWSAKRMYHDTELSIRGDLMKKIYTVSLIEAPRQEGLDIRCW